MVVGSRRRAQRVLDDYRRSPEVTTSLRFGFSRLYVKRNTAVLTYYVSYLILSAVLTRHTVTHAKG